MFLKIIKNKNIAKLVLVHSKEVIEIKPVSEEKYVLIIPSSPEGGCVC